MPTENYVAIRGHEDLVLVDMLVNSVAELDWEAQERQLALISKRTASTRLIESLDMMRECLHVSLSVFGGIVGSAVGTVDRAPDLRDQIDV